MEHLLDDLKKMVNADDKSISAFVLYLSLIGDHDSIITPVGKVTKINSNQFNVTIDSDVVDKASAIVLGDEFDFDR